MSFDSSVQSPQFAIWEEISSWPHNDIVVPLELADQNSTELKLFEKDVYGVLLSTYEPCGFSGFPLRSTVKSADSELNYLHLFNSEDIPKVISGQVDGLQFFDICIPANNRVILALV